MFSTNTYTKNERIAISLLEEKALNACYRISLYSHRNDTDSLITVCKAKGILEGISFALELMSGIPANSIADRALSVTYTELNAWMRGDIELFLI